MKQRPFKPNNFKKILDLLPSNLIYSPSKRQELNWREDLETAKIIVDAKPKVVPENYSFIKGEVFAFSKVNQWRQR